MTEAQREFVHNLRRVRELALQRGGDPGTGYDLVLAAWRATSFAARTRYRFDRFEAARLVSQDWAAGSREKAQSFLDETMGGVGDSEYRTTAYALGTITRDGGASPESRRLARTAIALLVSEVINAPGREKGALKQVRDGLRDALDYDGALF